MAGENSLGQSGVEAIRDQVNGITLGPSVTENGGRVLDVSQMSPEAAGNQLNAQAMQLLQQQNQQNQQLLAQTQQQNQQLMQGLTQAIQNIGSNQQPTQQQNPAEQYQLTQEDLNELGTLNEPVSKASRYAAEQMKQEVLGDTQGMINQFSTETNNRIAQLENELAQSKSINDSNFRTQLDGLAMQYGINMDTLATNAQWQALLNQPVSQFDRTPIRDKINDAVAVYDLGFFNTLLRQFAQQHGGNVQVSGAADYGQQNPVSSFGTMQPEAAVTGNIQGMQPAVGVAPMGMGPNQQGPAINSAQAQDLRQLEQAQAQIVQQRENLKRQLFDERSISREDYATQSQQLLELETQLMQKLNALTGAAA